jgi:hypothetical protein
MRPGSAWFQSKKERGGVSRSVLPAIESFGTAR